MTIRRIEWLQDKPAGDGVYYLSFRFRIDPPNVFKPSPSKVRSVSKIRFSPFEVRR